MQYSVLVWRLCSMLQQGELLVRLKGCSGFLFVVNVCVCAHGEDGAVRISTRFKIGMMELKNSFFCL